MNSYLSLFMQIRKRNLPVDILQILESELRKHYSWVVPSVKAIDLLKGLRPIVELGAGTGYWASLIGGNYTAIDIDPLPEEMVYHPIEEGDANSLIRFDANHTLFICCPQYRSNMLLEALHSFPGLRLVYVGDHDFALQFGGEVQKELDDNWCREKIISLDNWPNTNNKLSVWVRNKNY